MKTFSMLLGEKYEKQLKKVLLQNLFLHRVGIEIKIIQKKYKMYRVAKEARKLGVVLHGPECMEWVHRKSNVCHIVGSGWSVEESKKIITSHPNDFVIGFNFSCLLGVNFDMYMLEFGGRSCENIAMAQKRAFDMFVKKKNAFTIFKNIWEDKNNLDYAYNLYGDDVYYVRDIAITCFHEKNLSQSISLLLARDGKYFRQYRSTVTTCIAIARMLGFKEIVLHGIDFGGGYFFDRPEYSEYESFKPPVSDNAHAYKTSSRADDSVHPTSASTTGMRYALPILREKLLEENINLYCASSSSPCAKVLPVYKGG